MKLRVLGSHILVQRDKASAVSSGGILIPNMAQGKAMRGWVLSVGSRVSCIKMGHRVLFSNNTGVDVKLDSNSYLLLHEDNILGIVS